MPDVPQATKPVAKKSAQEIAADLLFEAERLENEAGLYREAAELLTGENA